MKFEIPSLAVLVIIGTDLLARVPAQGVEQALFSTVISLLAKREKEKVKSSDSSSQVSSARADTGGEKGFGFLNGDREMKCQRCFRDEATYTVYTDAIDMEVCFACAEEACKLGIAVEVLDSSENMKRRWAS
jgi:hypothetical protein